VHPMSHVGLNPVTVRFPGNFWNFELWTFIASVTLPLHQVVAKPKAKRQEIDRVKGADGFWHRTSITPLISHVRFTSCVQWTYRVNSMPTRTVHDLSARYLPEWAIFCHANFGAQRAHIRSNQQDSTSFVRFAWPVKDRICTQTAIDDQ